MWNLCIKNLYILGPLGPYSLIKIEMLTLESLNELHFLVVQKPTSCPSPHGRVEESEKLPVSVLLPENNQAHHPPSEIDDGDGVPLRCLSWPQRLGLPGWQCWFPPAEFFLVITFPRQKVFGAKTYAFSMPTNLLLALHQLPDHGQQHCFKLVPHEAVDEEVCRRIHNQEQVHETAESWLMRMKNGKHAPCQAKEPTRRHEAITPVIFRSARASWNTFVSPLVRPSVRKKNLDHIYRGLYASWIIWVSIKPAW